MLSTNCFPWISLFTKIYFYSGPPHPQGLRFCSCLEALMRKARHRLETLICVKPDIRIISFHRLHKFTNYLIIFTIALIDTSISSPRI